MYFINEVQIRDNFEIKVSPIRLNEAVSIYTAVVYICIHT